MNELAARLKAKSITLPAYLYMVQEVQDKYKALCADYSK
jgi:hypothetical protein